MKKILPLLILIFLIVFDFGCSGVKHKNQKTKSTAKILKKKAATSITPSDVEIEIGGCGLEGSINDRVIDCSTSQNPRETKWSQVMKWEEPEKQIEIWREDADYPSIFWSDLVKTSATYSEATELCLSLNKNPEYSEFENIKWSLPTFNHFAKSETHGIRLVLPNIHHIYWTNTFASKNETYLFDGKDGALAKGNATSSKKKFSVRCIGTE